MTDSPQPTRPVALLGDTDTQAFAEMFTHAESHGVQVRSSHFFEPGAIDEDTRAATHPIVINALRTAAQQGWGLFLPEPGDLGSVADQISIVSVAAHLAVPVYVGPHAQPWQMTYLPGLSTTDTISISAQGWRMFLGEVGSELLTTHLALAIADLDEAA